MLFMLTCSFFQLSEELDKLLRLGEVVDMAEVSRLRSEVVELKSAKSKLERDSDILVEENKASADKIFGLLSENSGLVSECDSLSATVKTLQGDLSSLNEAFEVAKGEFSVKELTLTGEKQELTVKLEESVKDFDRVQAQSLSSFEEGYRECYARFSAGGYDLKENNFEAYLVDLHNKMGSGGSSNHPGEDGV